MFDDVVETVYEFDPKSDITVKQLALFVKTLSNCLGGQIGVTKEIIDSMPSGMQQHFTEVIYVNGIKQESS